MQVKRVAIVFSSKSKKFVEQTEKLPAATSSSSSSLSPSSSILLLVAPIQPMFVVSLMPLQLLVCNSFWNECMRIAQACVWVCQKRQSSRYCFAWIRLPVNNCWNCSRANAFAVSNFLAISCWIRCGQRKKRKENKTKTKRNQTTKRSRLMFV